MMYLDACCLTGGTSGVKLLLYGGCHALRLRDHIHAGCPGEVACTLIVHFDLIRSGAPFPYS